jgi:hypothetical protein
MTLRVVLDKILFEATNVCRVFNLLVGHKKCLDTTRISCWLHTNAYIVVEELQV